MGYAIICNARKGEKLGIDVLALVDRKRTKGQWWTSDDPNLIINYQKRSAASFACSRLRMNNPRVVEFEKAFKWIVEQRNEITHQEAMASSEQGWDDHKAWTVGL